MACTKEARMIYFHEKGEQYLRPGTFWHDQEWISMWTKRGEGESGDM
jgi:hypothetical protein